jgi:hypothetical protein
MHQNALVLIVVAHSRAISACLVKVIPDRILDNANHCFFLLNCKQLKGKVICLVKQQSDSRHCTT